MSPGTPQETQVSPGTPQETQVSPGTPQETQVSPGKPAENTSSKTAAAGSVLESVSTNVLLEQSSVTVPRVLVTAGETADSFTIAATAQKPVLSHLWPESFVAGLALGLTAYGAVRVTRRRQERSISEADLDLFLTSSTQENQETAPDLLKV